MGDKMERAEITFIDQRSQSQGYRIGTEIAQYSEGYKGKAGSRNMSPEVRSKMQGSVEVNTGSEKDRIDFNEI